MSEGDQDNDKQYEPSQKKLDDARKKGEIPRSTDLTTAAAYGGFLIALLSVGPSAVTRLAARFSVLLAQVDDTAAQIFEGGGSSLAGRMLIQISSSVGPLLALPAAFAIASVAIQRGFLFTGSKLAPKLNRISPISGAKNKFGRQGLFEFAKSSTKLTIYAVILGFFLAGQIDTILGATRLPPQMIIAVLGRMLISLLSIVLIVALFLGGVDYLWQRAEHIRKNRMSRKEMMDEQKESDGDPFMKQKRRQRGQEIATNKMLRDVPAADVVIVNPTHYAVALKWDRAQAAAPVCVAKGVDEVAARIRQLAAENAVPIHADPPTARALHAEVALGQEIAQEHYQAVAAAIRFAESIRQRARQR